VQQPVEEEEKPKKKKSKKKSKEAEEVPSPVVNLFRSALMSLLKALTQLEESQDMTEEALALSCHLQRMVKSSTRSAANKASASAKSNAVNGASSQDVWNGGSGGDASGLYQLEIIHY
jgi:RNA processing factor Prp31